MALLRYWILLECMLIFVSPIFAIYLSLLSSMSYNWESDAPKSQQFLLLQLYFILHSVYFIIPTIALRQTPLSHREIWSRDACTKLWKITTKEPRKKLHGDKLLCHIERFDLEIWIRALLNLNNSIFMKKY